MHAFLDVLRCFSCCFTSSSTSMIYTRLPAIGECPILSLYICLCNLCCTNRGRIIQRCQKWIVAHSRGGWRRHALRKSHAYVAHIRDLFSKSDVLPRSVLRVSRGPFPTSLTRSCTTLQDRDSEKSIQPQNIHDMCKKCIFISYRVISARAISNERS